MKIAVLPGDGIGPEVMNEASKVLDAVSRKFSLSVDSTKADVGGVAHDKHGTALPETTLKLCEASDAILFGSVGGPKWDNLPPEQKIERVALLALRKRFNLYANLRPAVVYNALKDASPLRADIVKDGFDILIVRELTSGIYFGKRELTEEYAYDEMRYTKEEVRRVIKAAFAIALQRQKKLTCVDKSNVLSSGMLFRKEFENISKDYPAVTVDYLFIDNAAMQILKRPHDFDVMVTTNLFGDILSDEAAMLTGSIGMLASASLNEKAFGMYEPAGGSAPDIAGKGIANPIAQILSVAMMLKYSFKQDLAATAIEKAVVSVLEQGYRTGDIMQPGMKLVNTKEMGDLAVKALH